MLCPPPGDLPDPGIESWSPALQAGSLPSEPQGSPPSSRGTSGLLRPGGQDADMQQRGRWGSRASDPSTAGTPGGRGTTPPTSGLAPVEGDYLPICPSSKIHHPSSNHTSVSQNPGKHSKEPSRGPPTVSIQVTVSRWQLFPARVTSLPPAEWGRRRSQLVNSGTGRMKVGEERGREES